MTIERTEKRHMFDFHKSVREMCDDEREVLEKTPFSESVLVIDGPDQVAIEDYKLNGKKRTLEKSVTYRKEAIDRALRNQYARRLMTDFVIGKTVTYRWKPTVASKS